MAACLCIARFSNHRNGLFDMMIHHCLKAEIVGVTANVIACDLIRNDMCGIQSLKIEN